MLFFPLARKLVFKRLARSRILAASLDEASVDVAAEEQERDDRRRERRAAAEVGNEPEKQRDAVELRVVLCRLGPSRTAAILPMAQPIIAMPMYLSCGNLLSPSQRILVIRSVPRYMLRRAPSRHR